MPKQLATDFGNKFKNIERTNDIADITVDYDNVSVVVKSVNVKHAVNLAAKNEQKRYTGLKDRICEIRTGMQNA